MSLVARPDPNPLPGADHFGRSARIVAVELGVGQLSSSSLFDLAASTAIVGVSLASAYALENSSRAAWSRQRELDQLTRVDSLPDCRTVGISITN